MMLSNSLVLSSFSGIALSAGNAAAGGEGGRGGGKGVYVCDVLPGAFFLFLSIPEQSMKKALHFHAMQIIHQTLHYSVSKVYLQVNSKNRCRNWSFLFQRLRKKLLNEKCVVNLTLQKVSFSVTLTFNLFYLLTSAFANVDSVWTGANPPIQANSSLSSIDVNELRSEHKSCEWSKTVLHLKDFLFQVSLLLVPLQKIYYQCTNTRTKKIIIFEVVKERSYFFFYLIYKVQSWAYWEH